MAGLRCAWAQRDTNMTVFLLSWKEGILFAALLLFIFTPWSKGLRRYVLLGLVIYLLNKPLIANFHPQEVVWWLRDPAAWITAATWLGSMLLLVRWLQRVKGQGIWNALSEVPWQSHLIVLSLIIVALFLFNLSKISPECKTQTDFSFPLVIVNVPLQYCIGLYALKSSGESVKHPIPLVLMVVLVCILLVSFFYIPRTISEYTALLKIAPSHEGAVELIERWEALLERNKAPSIGTIRSTAYGRIGDLKLLLEDMDGARQWYKKALREDFDDVTAHIGLARLLVRKGETEEAKETFQKGIRLNPSLSWEQLANVFPPLRFQEIFVIAQALEAEGKQDEAFHAYSKALVMNPQNPWANFRLGNIYLSRGDYDKSRAAFQKTLAKAPRHLYALSYLVDIYAKQGKMNLARKYRDIILSEVVTHRIRPSDWRGKHGGRLYGKGGCHTTIKLYKGRVKFQIQARGTPAQGIWPHMVVKLNEEIIGETDVTNGKWNPYSFTTDVEAGEYTLGVYFTNDLCLEKEVGGKKVREDRNLFVGTGEIAYVR
jgi:tetratricopeptide (TPR) repeat protein